MIKQVIFRIERQTKICFDKILGFV